MTDIYLPQGVKNCIGILEKHGYKAYAVGGCVRDSLLGKLPKDYDVTTSALPEQMIACFDKTIPTGIKFGTVTVMLDGMGIEVTTFRSECQYDDYRRPSKIDFAADISSDLSRRDFTINAMAYNPSDGLIDLFGGREHLRQGVICAVGNPEERFGEDALRIMRAFRFALRFGFSIQDDTLSAALRLSKNLCKISVERIASELIGCLLTDNPAKIKPLIDTGALGFVGIKRTAMNFERLDLVEKDRYARLCALILLCETDNPYNICKALKLDGRTIKSVNGLLKNCDSVPADTRREVCRLLRDIGPELTDSLISVRRAALCENMDRCAEIKKEALQNNIPYCISMLDIDGDRLYDRAGIPKGKATGAVLNRLLQLAIDDPQINNETALVDKARAMEISDI